jgi:divalent metal cation (Fe/Co/Zn/Cd) transporter
VVAIFIFAIGSGVSMYEGIHHLYHPWPMKYIFANYIVLALAMIFEGSTWLVAFREFSRSKGRRGYLEMVRRAKNPSVFVVLFEDSASLLGLLVAFLGILLGQLTGKAHYDGGLDFDWSDSRWHRHLACL